MTPAAYGWDGTVANVDPAYLGLGISALALVVSIASAVVARRAKDEMRRQADAAEESVTIARAEAQRASDHALAEREAGRFVWKIDGGNGHCSLRNLGTDTAHDVRISSDSVSFTGGDYTAMNNNGQPTLKNDEMLPGSTLRFAFVSSPYVGHGWEVAVEWREGELPVRVPLPHS